MGKGVMCLFEGAPPGLPHGGCARRGGGQRHPGGGQGLGRAGRVGDVGRVLHGEEGRTGTEAKVPAVSQGVRGARRRRGLLPGLQAAMARYQRGEGPGAKQGPEAGIRD